MPIRCPYRTVNWTEVYQLIAYDIQIRIDPLNLSKSRRESERERDREIDR